jgi:putative ABC transport system substrate-binding protein
MDVVLATARTHHQHCSLSPKGDPMKRRDFVAGLMIASAMRHAVAQPAKTKRIAVVSSATKVSDMRAGKNWYFPAFFEELNRLGYVEGQTLVVERYSAEGRREHHVELARDVVGTRPDVILALSGPLALVFKAATTEIPIVASTADPVALGLVPSLAHPGGNITGVSVDAGFQLYEKWIELLKELVPKLSSVFFLASQPHWERPESSVVVREGAKRAGTSLIPILLGPTFNEAAYESAFKSMEQDRADALLVSNEGEHITYRALLVRLVAERRLPAMYPFRVFVDSGGLMTYATDLADLFRRLAVQIVDILKGTKPQDIPFINRRNLNWLSTSRRPSRRRLTCRPRCSPALMRSSNRDAIPAHESGSGPVSDFSSRPLSDRYSGHSGLHVSPRLIGASSGSPSRPCRNYGHGLSVLHLHLQAPNGTARHHGAPCTVMTRLRQ